MTVNCGIATTGSSSVTINPALTQTQKYTRLGNVDIAGSQSVGLTTPGAYPYSVLSSDNTILVSTASPRTITMLASPLTGNVLTIKDVTGSAASNNITVSGNGKNINGSATYVMNVNSQTAVFLYNGTAWFTISGASSSGGGFTTIGDVTSGSVAFDGTAGTTLTGTTAGMNILVASSGSSAGNLVLLGGATSFSGNAGGSSTLQGGTGNGSGTGGDAVLQGGTPGTTGAGGRARIFGGNGGSSSGNGGIVQAIGGDAVAGTATGGSVNLQGGTGSNASGGSVNILTGSGFNAGNFSLTCGTTSNASGASVSLTAGTGNSAAGGDIVITTGTGNGSGAGGTWSMIGANGGATGNGGPISIISGGGGATSGTGGSISITGGTGVGTNRTAANITFTSAKGTGSGAVGKILFLSDAQGTAAGTTTHTSVNRMGLNGSIRTLTSGAASTIITPTIASNTMACGYVEYSTESSDGTDFQVTSGLMAYSITNKAGTISGTATVIGSEVTNVTAGSLTNAFSVTAAGLVQVTPTVTGLTATTLRITYAVFNNAQQTISLP